MDLYVKTELHKNQTKLISLAMIAVADQALIKMEINVLILLDECHQRFEIERRCDLFSRNGHNLNLD